MAVEQGPLENLDMKIDHSFWQAKRVLVTGHTGFKGGWLAIWLQNLGADVYGIALPPESSPNLHDYANVAQGMESIYCDIRDVSSLEKEIYRIQPEIIFHLAAQPLVRASYKNPVETYATNVMGSVHILEAARKSDRLRVVVMATTDKVYENLNLNVPFKESDKLGGHDPYSASKAASEIVIDSYRKSFLAEQAVAVASARAGNVIGGGDWSESRLIPDAIKAWQAGSALCIRHPDATRPWQHVLDPLSGYLVLAQALAADPGLSGAYNFGPPPHQAASVRNVAETARQHYGSGEIIFEKEQHGFHESTHLSLDTAKAEALLGVKPRWSLNEAIGKTISWYKNQQNGADARELCEQDISEYESLP